MIKLEHKDEICAWGYYEFNIHMFQQGAISYEDWLVQHGGELVMELGDVNSLCISFENDEDAMIFKLRYCSRNR